MRSLLVLGGLLGAGLLAPPAAAQQPYGPWVHDANNALLHLYVAPNGVDAAGGGLTPANPLRTLGFAVAEADSWFSIFWRLERKGVTINLAPTTHTLTGPVQVPAFGVSIEPTWSPNPAAQVVLDLPVGWPGRGILEYTTPLGPLSTQAFGDAADELAGLPPSTLRGVRLQGNPSGYGVWIDPTQNAPDKKLFAPVAVGVYQCDIVGGTSRGVFVSRDPSAVGVYRNEIVDNEIHGVDWGLFVTGGDGHSDLIRSNRVYDCRIGAEFSRNAGTAVGSLRPRILSNSFVNIGSHTFAPPAFPSSFGILFATECSAQVVGNTIAYTQHVCLTPTCVPPAGLEPSGITYFNGPTSAGETLVIANNLFWNPPYASGPVLVDPFEIAFPGGAFAGTLVLESNDFEAATGLVNPPIAVPPSNTAIGDPLFVSGVPTYDVHLTPASTGVVGLGSPAFTLPGAASSFAIGPDTFAADCALDFDLDARTHQPAGAPGAILYRGADQLVDDVALAAPTVLAGVPATELADRFGTVTQSPGGGSVVWLQVSGPAGSVYFTSLCSTLPLGPEQQHVVIPPWGSLAIDPSAGSSLVIDAGGIGAAPTSFRFDMGTLVPAFLEAEMYLQTLVLRPDGTGAFTNRIRLDLDQS